MIRNKYNWNPYSSKYIYIDDKINQNNVNLKVLLIINGELAAISRLKVKTLAQKVRIRF